MTTPIRPVTPWYRQRWPWILMSGPAIVIVAGIVTAMIAFRSNDGVVADDYYKQGLTVNQRLQRDHQAKVLDVAAELMAAGQQWRLRVTAAGKPVVGQALKLTVVHPTRAGEDQSPVLQDEGGGLYGAVLAKPLGSGRWVVMLDAPEQGWRLQGQWNPNADATVVLRSADLAVRAPAER